MESLGGQIPLRLQESNSLESDSNRRDQMRRGSGLETGERRVKKKRKGVSHQDSLGRWKQE